MPEAKKLQRWGWTVFLHTFGTGVLAVLFTLPSLDWTRAQMLFYSYSVQGMEPNWAAFALHIGLAACAWALLVIGYKLFQMRRSEKKQLKRVLIRSRGTALTETLIVLIPFFLLTSGIAQLSQLNVTGILADLAVFQAARAVFVWSPETTQPRFESSYKSTIIKDRARTIAAMSLAPTAPNEYTVGRIPVTGSSDYFRRQRNVMVGAFRTGTPGTNWIWSASNPAAFAWGLAGGTSVGGMGVTYNKAFDESSMDYRAARKMTQAEWGLWQQFETICPHNCDTTDSNHSGVHFTYWYNIVFPWFGYIWGDYETVGMRPGWYDKIERKHLFPAQPMP